MKHMNGRKRNILAVMSLVLLLLAAGFAELAEARSRGGGRSFGGRAFSRPTTQPRPVAPDRISRPSTSPLGGGAGAFTRGLAGGMLGGFLGSMLFGGTAHGMGAGGFGGSGIGLFEILLLAGLGYFLYKRFYRPRAFPAGMEPGRNAFGNATRLFDAGSRGRQEAGADDLEDPLVAGVREIWEVDETFHPERFKETAQDLFFKIQAGWTRRDTGPLREFVGDQLLSEYERHFAEMRQQGHINRLENIAVRNVELVNAGVDGQEIFVTIRFTANLLDYTVNDRTGDVLSGDPENPVKFQENWTFARPAGGGNWKLEGIEEQS
ncbi:MAG: Tim44 domain-containing protein [Thermodesulfobacteriota bacterium]